MTVVQSQVELLDKADLSQNASSRIAFANLSLARKVALIPTLTLLLMGLMLIVGLRMNGQNTAALRALDRDVFEPLNRAQTLKDRITALHTSLFALLSTDHDKTDPVAQQASEDALLLQLDTEVANFNQFLDANTAVSATLAARLPAEFKDYVSKVRVIASFAAYDPSYGALIAGSNDQFGNLRADLNILVELLAQRRTALTNEAIGSSLAAQEMLLGLGGGVTMLTLLGSIAVGRSIANPVLRLTAMMDKLAAGDTSVAVPGTQRRDEVGAMAHAVQIFRANLKARRQAEITLRRTHLQFDAALNSMLQGMIVFGPDRLVQLVNGRYYSITSTPLDSITAGLTVREVIDITVSSGLYPGENPGNLCESITSLLSSRRSMQLEVQMRPGLFVQIAAEPMVNGGSVLTFEDVTEKRQSEAQIAFMARHDALTGLPNRRLFQEHMAEMLEKAEESEPFSVLCLDLDHFKEVNDTLGHAAGDELLRLVAARLRSCTRDHDLIARLGGDEFAIVLANSDRGTALATSIATRLVDSIGASYEIQGHDVVVGTSIGIALSEPGVSGADLLKRADVALYRAKEERGTFAFFEPGMDELLQARRAMEVDLRLALHRDEFELNYQPLYTLDEKRVTAFEALIRWNSPTRGQVGPVDFIPLAEQTGLIIPIGEWVLRTACAEATLWPDHVRVAVNLSAVQTKNKHLVALVRETLEQTGLPPRRLELEITESVLLQDTEVVMTMLHSFHEMGVKIAMDDFGTGYSSLSYLRRFPFDKIKIDRSFVCDMSGTQCESGETGEMLDTDSPAAKSAATIVRAIVGLGDNLGISTTAEGVETAQQFAQLRHNGCTEVQGYFISPPRPANEVAGLLQWMETVVPAHAKNRVVAVKALS